MYVCYENRIHNYNFSNTRSILIMDMDTGDMDMAQAIQLSIMMYNSMVNFCFHIEFPKMTTVINCCELKKINYKKAIIVTCMLHCYTILQC